MTHKYNKSLQNQREFDIRNHVLHARIVSLIFLSDKFPLCPLFLFYPEGPEYAIACFSCQNPHCYPSNVTEYFPLWFCDFCQMLSYLYSVVFSSRVSIMLQYDLCLVVFHSSISSSSGPLLWQLDVDAFPFRLFLFLMCVYRILG